MLVSKKISFRRIIKGTWKHLLLDLVTCLVSYYLYEHVIKSQFQLPAMVPTILGTALAFFIGFSNNHAYDRWWEARKIWGALVNDSRTWARQVMFYTNVTNEHTGYFSNLRSKLIYRQIAFVYALKQRLRKSEKDDYNMYLTPADAASVKSRSNIANGILDLQARDLDIMLSNNIIDGFRFLGLNNLNQLFCEQMGKSERIANTVFPVTYAYYTRVFIWIFIVSITMVASDSIGSWSILVGTLVGYIFLTTHKIGGTLLNPFIDLETGIPLNQISKGIEIDLLETLGNHEIPDPIITEGKEFVY